MAWERNGRFTNRPYGETGGWGWIPAPRVHGGRALRGNNGGEGGFKVMTFDLCGDDAKQGAGRRVDGRHIW